MRKVLQCHVGIGSEVKGIALVADDNFSARYDLDRVRGVSADLSTNSMGKAIRM